MLINNSEVKEQIEVNPETNEVVSINYDYFACTCDDKDEKYFKNITEEMFPEFHKEESLKRRNTLMIRELAKYGWFFEDCGADMWMGASFIKPATDTSPQYTAYIQCDLLVYALTTALIIAKELDNK